MKSELFIFGLFIILGLFSFIAAIFNLNWFFSTNGAATFIKWFGRAGARVFYALLGLGLVAAGVAGFSILE